MEQLNAFVGHSFTEEDTDIVRAFLNFFDTVRKMNIGFDWEHAEDAKSKTLREKVLQLIEGKNLFIGICTNKEAAIHPSKLKKVALKDSFKAGGKEFESKTSDWIIQEIGLAIGRNMDLILLVENGVRQPGGLQGNLEYINFDRNSPEKSFEKILEMIQSLLPKARPATKRDDEVLVVPQEDDENKKEEEEDWLQPQPEWNRRNYEIALIHMMATDDDAGVERICAAYLASEEGQERENEVSWGALHEYYRISWGKGGSLETLKTLSKENPENPFVYRYLGMSYRKYEDFVHAADSFKQAADLADSTTDKIDFLAESLGSLSKSGSTEEANNVALEMKKLIPEGDEVEAKVLRSLRSLAENDNDDDAFLGLSERYLSLCPDDIDARFSIAYKYSKRSLEGLSLMHYLKIPSNERSSGTWNNLGVQFDRLEFAQKSVEAYRRAEEMGETLAMSNLAEKLISQGFIDEAEEICTKAIEIKDYHKNIGHAVSKIKDMPDEETKKEKEIVLKSKAVSDFFKDYGHALVQDDLPNLSGYWQGPDCRLNINIKGGEFSAEGSYEQSANAFSLGGALSGLATLSGGQSNTTKYLLSYKGTVKGRATSASYVKSTEGESPKTEGLLGAIMNETSILMVFSADHEKIVVYEKNGSRTEKIYTMTKIAEGKD